MTELEKIQLQHATLEYYLKGLQIVAVLKKDFPLQQRLEEKIYSLIREISPEPAIVVPTPTEAAAVTDLRQG